MEGEDLHNNKLKQEIFIIRTTIHNIYQSNPNKAEYFDAITVFMADYEKVISRCKCIDCKVSAALQVQLLNASSLA
jgi:hypothetical protein